MYRQFYQNLFFKNYFSGKSVAGKKVSKPAAIGQVTSVSQLPTAASSAPAAISSAPAAASSAPAADLMLAVSTAAVGRVSHNPSQKGNSQNSHKCGWAFDGSNSVRPKKGSYTPDICDSNQIQRIPTT